MFQEGQSRPRVLALALKVKLYNMARNLIARESWRVLALLGKNFIARQESREISLLGKTLGY